MTTNTQTSMKDKVAVVTGAASGMGLAIAKLFIEQGAKVVAADPRLMEKSGQVFTSAGLALEYGYTDIDGHQPRPNSLETV